MKLLIDMFACQTRSRFRGIGRYSLSLAREMARLRGANEMIALADSLYRESFEDLRQEFIRLLPVGTFLPYHHSPIKYDKPQDITIYDQIAATLVRQAYQSVSPDIVFTPSPFEGWLEQGVVPSPNSLHSAYSQVAILYDLIPFIFSEQYLEQNLAYKAWYLERLNNLNKYDLLLAISEATRQDAINILGIEPKKIVNISGAADPQFHKIYLTDAEKRAFFQRFGITRPFVFTLGADDFRKNGDGALRAYAQLPRNIIETHQLVTNYSGDKTAFENKLEALGLTKNDVVYFNHVNDKDLVTLYNLCKLFFFPSLYEGFGLPVLEAMSCGAPVIASNNSSLPELVVRTDALFDATSDQAITSQIYKALTDQAFRAELGAHGLEQARKFSWTNAAQCAWDAIENMKTEGEKSEKLTISLSPSSQRQRIAFVSPLPPQKSGIAEYSADLLPYLAKYFEIDLFVEPGLKTTDRLLQEKFAVYPWTKLIDRRDQYDTVIYHHGNSVFHSHMFNLERQFPGLVVLHDFFLGHIKAHIGIPKGEFHIDLDYSHGLRGIIEYSKKGFNVVFDYPINWQVLRNAQGLVVHSNYHNHLLKKYFGHGWRPRPKVIKQLYPGVPEISAEQRLNARKQLGLESNKFLFCAFGMLTPEKLTSSLILAYAQACKKNSENTMLIFAGEYVNQDYQKKIEDLIKQHNLEKQVYVTGYLSKENYKNYLSSADVAIQLRTNSRGETSRAVLECMAHGIPTVINAHATFDDYSSDDVVKLSDPLNIDDLTQEMVRLRTDETFRLEKGQRARKAITEQHDPEQIAIEYANMIRQAIQTDERKLFAPLIDALLKMPDFQGSIISESRNAAANLQLRRQVRVLVDVTHISSEDLRSGIQRVVKNLIKELLLRDDSIVHVEPVRLNEGKLLRSNRFTEKLLNIPDQSLGPEVPINILPGDVLFMLDTSWHIYDQFIPIFQQIRQTGGKIVSMIYDLIPVRFPHITDQSTADMFNVWINSAIRQSDFLVCISQTVADDVAAYIAEKKIIPSYQLDITYIHLGADIEEAPHESVVRETVRELGTRKSIEPMFLMVGTVEPRKGYSFTIDAFEQLWQQGHNFRLCIAGKIGWMVEEIERRIRNHPELGKRLFFIERPTDAEINLLYSASIALIAASMTEGFGLPIVEAALHQVPVIASDIPIFHEVGKTGALYFSLESPDHLVDSVISMSKLSENERQAMAKKVNVLTWKESAKWVLEVIEGRHIYHSFPLQHPQDVN